MTKPLLATFGTALVGILVIASNARAADTPPHFDRDIAPLIQRHCVKCHGPAKQEAKLNLAASSGLVRGGKSGPAIVPHDADASLLWQRVASDEMPPDAPLTADEKLLLKRWIIAGTPGLARDGKDENASDHWAFRPLVPSPPSSGERARVRGPSGADAPPHKSDSPSKSFPNATSPNSIAPPHPHPLPPKSGGEGTSEERQQHWNLRLQLDPDARRLSRFPVRRLDAEAIRDAMLSASGDLDDRLFGPYIPTTRTGVGETIVAEDHPGSKRRSIYLQQKRTQVHSLLQVFDAPSIVFNSTRRPRSTMPLQSLNQLNSDFSVARARSLANRLDQEATSDSERLHRAFVLTNGRPPSDDEVSVAMKFLEAQAAEYSNQSDARLRAWSDLGQMLLIGNSALYLE